MRKIVPALLLLFAINQPLLAAECEDLPKLKTSVKTLAVFKNGLGFVFRSGETPLKDGWASMDEIPQAVLGTLWIGTTTPSANVREVVSYRCETQNTIEAANIPDILEVNVGKRVTITYLTHSSPEAEHVSAVISSASAGSGIVILQLDNGSVLIVNKADIVSLVLDKDSPVKKASVSTINAAKLRIGPADTHKSDVPKSAEISVAYLEKGITWSPSYLVNIANEKEADITMEAVLANDMEDMENVDVSFVVGYPNFMFADSLTPLLLQQSVGDFIGRLSSTPSASRSAGGYGAITTQSILYNVPSASRAASNVWNPESSYSANQSIEGESNEDLYFYTQPNVSLKKGSRARYTIFTGKVPYEHMYQWRVPDEMNIDYRGYRRGDDRGGDVNEQVWHSLRLTNTLKQPWTTAPAFTVNGSMPVAQDVLGYTPFGGKSMLRLTVATDVRAEQSQTEVSRVQVPNDQRYDLVKVDGVLTVKNMKPDAIRINVKKSLVGEVLSADQDGKVTKVAKRIAAVNPNSEIEWEFDLAPGVEQKLTYQYQVMVYR